MPKKRHSTDLSRRSSTPRSMERPPVCWAGTQPVNSHASWIALDDDCHTFGVRGDERFQRC